MELTELQKREMSKLLDKYESRRDYGKIQVNNRRTMLRINARNYPDYFHISDASFRRRFNMEMRELERRGWVKLEWEEFERNQTLKRVILNTEELPSIYRELGREAKRDRYHRLQELVLQWQESAPEALQPFYRDLLERLSAYETLPPGLNSLKGLEDWSQLFRALNALLELKQEVPKRRFSVKLFGDSKRWDQLEKPVLWVLRNYCLSPEDQELEDEEIFSELGLLDNPGHINIAGPLQFRTPRGEINLFSFYPDLGLAPQMVEDLEITGLEAKAVVTVENLTSFYHYVDEGPADHLVIYLGGYHNRQRRQFLRKIYDFACRYRRGI
ncbi:Wadjet anti-phage system protein JetD domain-containing protein, partial [Calderihabitans maritimus]